MTRARKLVRQVAMRLFGDEVGCSDGGCVFGHPGGMQTNGGCQCIKEREPVILKRNLMRMAEVARVLACVSPETPAPEAKQ